VDELISLLSLEKSSFLLGGEEKANAILAAEPIIRQIHDITKRIKIDEINRALNSEEIRSKNNGVFCEHNSLCIFSFL